MNYRESKELKKCYEVINDWYKRKNKVLSIRTRPFNIFNIFYDVINKELNNKGSILYVWGSCNKEAINEKQEEFISTIFNEDANTNKIDFVNYDEIDSIEKEYNLVIYDDISLFSSKSKEDIRIKIENLYWKSRKMIIYSMEYIFPIGEKYDLVYLRKNNPIIEPRILKTRIKLDEDIPLTLFEYFKWFNENKKNVLIIVPTESLLDKVYYNYSNTLKKYNMKSIKYSKSQDHKFINDILEGFHDGLFIITNNIGDYIINIPNLNVIFLFSENSKYNYKQIVNMCGMVSLDSNELSEVILACKEPSQAMEESKKITRRINRSVWEVKPTK